MSPEPHAGRSPAPRLMIWLSMLLAVAISTTLAGCRPAVEEPSPLPPGSEATIELTIVEGSDSGIMAFVPVYIGDRGPFPFALDTGASHSVIDAGLAERLEMAVVGESVEMTGVASSPSARQHRVERWRVGSVELRPHIVVSIDMPDPGGRTGLVGLLGSDILSQFDRVTVDYDRQQLVLSPRR